MNNQSTQIHPKGHHKPFRTRHLTLAGTATVLFIVSSLSLLLFYLFTPLQLPPYATTQVRGQQTSQAGTVIRSTLGFSTVIDDFALDITLQSANQETIILNDTSATPRNITSIELRPQLGAIQPSAAASTLGVYHSSTQQLDELLAEFEQAEYQVAALSEEKIGELVLRRTVYQYQDKDIYSVVWQPVDEQHELTIVLRGLIGDSKVPKLYADVIEQIRLGETLGLQLLGRSSSSDWVGRSDSTRRYLSDLVSPAVVKLYHVVCAEVNFSFQDIPDAQCRATTGSGFFVSSEGHIATNGHVVVFEPEDAIVDALLNNPMQLSSFLGDVVGLNDQEIASLAFQPERLAAVVSQIYELPEGAAEFSAKDKVILAAIGDTPLLPQTEEEIFELFNFRDTANIKQAELLGFSYSGKDQLVVTSGDERGFSQSDIALLKIRQDNTPLIRLAPPADIQPGQPITILGFPSDAENELVDPNELVVSTTNGTISSIRTAAGGQGNLLQTDADASQGNSGGPAVLPNGRAVGLLTYRFKDETSQNAAKSYLRDIADLRSLIESELLSLNVNSTTQQAWSNGLELFANQRFSQALEQFAVVKEQYPPHRLVDRYITTSEDYIEQGLERSSPLAQVMGLTGGLGLLAASGQLLHRHHQHHRAFVRRQNQVSGGEPNGDPSAKNENTNESENPHEQA